MRLDHSEEACCKWLRLTLNICNGTACTGLNKVTAAPAADGKCGQLRLLRAVTSPRTDEGHCRVQAL